MGWEAAAIEVGKWAIIGGAFGVFIYAGLVHNKKPSAKTPEPSRPEDEPKNVIHLEEHTRL